MEQQREPTPHSPCAGAGNLRKWRTSRKEIGEYVRSAMSDLPFIGVVKTWKRERRFGFITRDDRLDIFCPERALKAAGLPPLEPGDRGAFDCATDWAGRLRVTRIALQSAPDDEAPPPMAA
jgi:cold shock CspA family protein